jgi:hypothetical protein
MSQEDIEKSLRNCLKENVYNVLANCAQNNQTSGLKKRQPGKQTAPPVVVISNTSVQSSEITSQEHMEIDLRGKLLDIAEQISIGALGSLKVSDRLKWKEALERGEYEPLCANLTWGDVTRPALECTNIVDGAKKAISSILSRLARYNRRIKLKK